MPQRPRHRDRRPRAALVLVQLPLRRLPGLPRPRHPDGGRPRAGHPGPAGDPRRGGDRALVRRPRQRLLHPAARGARRRARLRPEHPVGGPAGQGPEGHPRGAPDQGARAAHQPLRPRALLLHQLRGRPPLHRASPPRGGERHQPRALRGLHARGGLPDLPRHPPQAGLRGGHPRRQGRGREEHRRGLPAADQRGGRVPRRPRALLTGAPDRRARAQGDPGAAALPARRRARLPLARPSVGHAVRRRGAADPARHPDRCRSGGGALRPRRAEHRPAPARQPPADRDAGPAQGPRQHPDRGRARRGHDHDGRLGRRHRSRRGRARRPGGALRHGQAAAQAPRLGDRPLPLRSQVDPGPRRTPPADAGSRAHRPRRPREQPQEHRRQLPARHASSR